MARTIIFVDEARFKKMTEQGELLEWARVFGNYLRHAETAVTASIKDGRDVLFDIDWQGCQQLTEKMSGDLVRVFILPPSGDVLETRLRGRNQDPPEVVAKRMAEASAEISHWAEYDYVIVNGDIDASVDKSQSHSHRRTPEAHAATGPFSFRPRNAKRALKGY